MKDDSRKQQGNALHFSQPKAVDAAFRILARRDHTSRELILKLRRKGFDRQAIDGAIQRCRKLGYLDDAKTARTLAGRLAGKGYGPLRIRQALKQKGLDESLVEKILADGGEEEDQVRAAKKALEKKAFRLNRENDPWKRRQMAYRFLAGRGFSSSVINRAINHICRSSVAAESFPDRFDPAG